MWWLLWLGCSPGIDCSQPENLLAEVGQQKLTCAQATQVIAFSTLVAGRAPPKAQQEKFQVALRGLFRSNPTEITLLVKDAYEAGKSMMGTGDLAATARAKQMYDTHKKRGVILPKHGDLWNQHTALLSEWEISDENELVLAESDIEGVLYYASLCREVQGAEPLRISVADRMGIYRTVRERFASGSKAEQLAMLSVGPFWSDITDRWKIADYEEQQSWISRAPLPPPMMSTSLEYVDAVISTDLQTGVSLLHQRLGPFRLVGARSLSAQ